jgi:hypothetical protein
MLAALVLGTVVAAHAELLPPSDPVRHGESALAEPGSAFPGAPVAPRERLDPRAWSAGDVALQTVFTVGMVADWIQTRNTIAAHREVPGKPGIHYVELNPVLGRSPSRTAVDTYFLGMAAAQLAVTHLLPHGAWRTSWLFADIGFEGGIVARNLRMGIGFRF